MPDIAITALQWIPSIARALFEGSPFSGLTSEQLTAAIASLKDAGSASVGAVRFKHAEAARRDGDTIYALIRLELTDEPAEPFACLETAVLALYLRFLPASETRASRLPWLTTRERQANVRLPDGGQFQLVECPGPRPKSTFPWRSTKLFPIGAKDQNGLLSKLDLLEQRLSHNLDDLANAWRSEYEQDAPLAMALIARDEQGLRKEIEVMRRNLPKAFTENIEAKTPAGSYFTATPQGEGGVAFVYPGVGSPYVGIASDLFALAPPLLDRFDLLSNGQPARYLHVEEMYPREKSNDSVFYRNIIGVGEVAISTAVIFTMMLRDVFGVQPTNAMGYSFGEPMMLAALGVWPEPALLTSHLDRSPTFHTRLHGPMDAIRACWGLPAGEPVEWKSYTVRATMAQAFEAIKGESRAYVSVINTLEEVVLGGEPAACRRVLDKLGATAIEIPVNLTIHCQAVHGERAEFAAIHDLPTIAVRGIDFFSSATYSPLELTRENLRNAIADAYCKIVDFPRLVRKVHSNGARVFVEVGGRRNCCTWIEKILKGKPHVTIPCDSKGMGDDVSLLRALARLVSHRVPLSLDALYETNDADGAKAGS